MYEVNELVKKIIEKHKLDTNKVVDVCFALCMADNFVGSNRLNLTVDAFCRTSDNDWGSVLQTIGIQPLTGVGLPRVQRLRVITDALVICTKEHNENIYLTSEVSGKVALSLGLTIRSIEYKDESTVLSVLTELCGSASSFESILELEKHLETYILKCQAWGYNFESELRKALSKIKLPGEYKYIETDNSSKIDETKAYYLVCDAIMYYFETYFVAIMRTTLNVSGMKTHLYLNRILKKLKNVQVGLKSADNNVPRIEIEHGFPVNIQQKLNCVFNRQFNYDINDLDNVLTMIKEFYNKV